MARKLIPALLGLIAFLFFSGPVLAQGGYSKEKHPEHGLKFELARNYEWLAIQPHEKWIVLQWVEAARVAARKDKRDRPSGILPKMQIVRIDYVPDPAPETKGGGSDGEEKGDGKEGASEAKEKPKRPPPINSWERYAERRLRNWLPIEGEDGKPRDGYEAVEYELRVKKGSTRMRGWAYVWTKPRERTFVVLGWCGEEELGEQTKIWRHTAEKMRFSDPVADPETEKWTRYYERRPKFRNPEYRVSVRKDLGGDWEAEDTENYIIIYNTPDQPLVRRIVRELESIRKEYVRLFPPTQEVEAVSTVRICGNRDEYLAYSGLPGSAGYWNWATGELVLYDATKREKGKKTEKADTFIVLYHEAFHQYIYYSTGELGLHYWYNEGHADYFSGSQIKGGKVKRIGVNPWRLSRARKLVEDRRFVPWREMIGYERPQYYDPKTRSNNYAQGWSMVYFLKTCKKVQRDEQWSAILPTYYDTLKDAWAAKVDELEAEGKDENREEVAKAQLEVRKEALAKSFEGVDIDALEAEWIAYTLELEL